MKNRLLVMLGLVISIFAAQTKNKSDLKSEEMEEHLKTVKDNVRQINIRHGAVEWAYSDGFICIARNKQNADRKHNNWILLHRI